MKKWMLCTIIFLLSVNCSAQKIDLGLKLEIGKEYFQSTETKMIIAQEIENRYYVMTNHLRGDVTFKVKSVSDNTYSTEVRYGFLEMDMELPTGRITFSSRKQDTTDVFSLILSKMVGFPFYVKISKQGKVVAFSGVDRLIDSLLVQLKETYPIDQGVLRTQLMSSYGEESFKGNFEMVTAIYPDKPVRIGDSWQVSTKLVGQLSAQLNCTYTLAPSANNKVHITGNANISSIKSDNESASFQSNNLRGKMSSEFQVDERSGWISSAKILQEFEGDMFVKENATYPNGITIPMACSSEIKIVGEK